MTLPKKGLRNITVDNVKYAWNATGNDGSIRLSIIHVKHQQCIITASFSYHSKLINEHIFPDGDKVQSFRQQLIITGYIVRQVILYAMQEGWDPMGNVTVLNLGAMDDKIDLRIEQK
ncbi:hypothetical protein [Chitinophaga ginsengisoli]|uniref:Uncharacterized protein n=1 Tax=Chitinophaga ginsengisoli TaxID=363837 RepID=A0A2P8GH93_9BACT|nr:hypothetical protein [Chitinophaga ginsengisoli]PSL33317.1 hypothetical protein CLV42_103300 [Chitinophaga ginsengisoli]